MKRMNVKIPGFGNAALLLGLMTTSCVPTQKEGDLAGSGTELGNVVGMIHAPGNRPAAGITVTLYPDDPEIAGIKTAVTDSDGNFAFKDVMGGYSLYALDGAGNGLKVDSIEADTANPIDLELRLLSPLASIEGYAKVIGARTAGAKVELYLERSPFRLEVDPNSAFEWSDLPAGQYWLGVTYAWSKGFTLPITLAAGQTLDLDTLTVSNEVSAGISRRDTLKVSSSQLPLTLSDKLANDLGTVDSAFWVLNGTKLPASQFDRYFSFTLQPGSLTDTGYNVLEMRLYLPDTALTRAWYIDLDDTPVVPWARHAVKGIFLGQEDDPNPNSAGMKLGTFQILDRRLLSAAEMAFWNWTAVPGGDTALPGLVKIPMYRFGSGGNCGDMAYEAEPQLFPGDTVTFMTVPDDIRGGKAARIRKDERFVDFGNLAWFGNASWPQAGYYYTLKGGGRDIRIGAGALKVKLERNYRGPTGGTADCLPLSRSFTLGADGIPREYVAVPAGMSPANLLLNFRAGLPKGLFAEGLAASGDYVFLDSAGHGVAGSGAVTHEVQLSASELAELKAILAALPATIPLEWDKDYLDEASPLPGTTDYLLSGGRGLLLAGAPRTQVVPQAKLDLFQAVEAWLLAHDLL